MSEFLTTHPSYTKKHFFEKTLIEFCSPHLYASIGTFFVKIDQLFEISVSNNFDIHGSSKHAK